MNLSETQLVILTNARRTFDGNILPLPGSLRGAQAKVVDSLLKKGLMRSGRSTE